MAKIKGFFVLVAIVVLIILAIQTFQKKDFPNPSEVYYVNDYAHVLSSGVKRYIIQFSNDLYADTKGLGDGASQVVVATFLLKDETEIQWYRNQAVNLYNQWKIGDNNMGLLIMMLYTNEQFDGYTLPKFEAFLPIVGREMAQYLNESDLGTDMIDQILPLYYDEELALLHFYFEALTRIYRDAYIGEFEPFEYDMEYVEEVVESYAGEINSDGSSPMNLLDMALSPMVAFGDKIGLGAITGILVLFGGGILYTVGGGGRSDGAHIFRRRR